MERLIRNRRPAKITSEDVFHIVRRVFLQSFNPLMQDSNLKHVTRALERLPEPSRQLWMRLKRRESILTTSIDSATFQDLYLTGVCKAENNYVVVRNRIYKGIFVKKPEQEPQQGGEILPGQEVSQPIELFYSYAHQDERLRKRLETHLSALRQQKVITEWHDRKIVAGMDWKQSIDTHLATAAVILLLVSPDFLASDYCYGIEMQRALARHAEGDACVIPVILRPVDWQGTPFAHLQCAPTLAKPVTMWSNRDEAFRDVAMAIRTAIERLYPRHSSLPSAQ
jgi:TIR domain-containing protein